MQIDFGNIVWYYSENWWGVRTRGPLSSYFKVFVVYVGDSEDGNDDGRGVSDESVRAWPLSLGVMGMARLRVRRGLRYFCNVYTWYILSYSTRIVIWYHNYAAIKYNQDNWFLKWITEITKFYCFWQQNWILGLVTLNYRTYYMGGKFYEILWRVHDSIDHFWASE